MAQNQPMYFSKQARFEKVTSPILTLPKHATAAMNILEQDYSDEDHVFVFDNTTIHQK